MYKQIQELIRNGSFKRPTQAAHSNGNEIIQGFNPEIMRKINSKSEIMTKDLEAINSLLSSKKLKKIDVHISSLREAFLTLVILHSPLGNQLRYVFVSNADIMQDLEKFRRDISEIRTSLISFLLEWGKKQITEGNFYEFQSQFYELEDKLSQYLKVIAPKVNEFHDHAYALLKANTDSSTAKAV